MPNNISKTKMQKLIDKVQRHIFTPNDIIPRASQLYFITLEEVNYHAHLLCYC